MAKKKKKVSTPYDGIDELNILLFKNLNKYFNQTRLKLTTKKKENINYSLIQRETKSLYNKIQKEVLDNYLKCAKEINRGIDRDELLDFLEDFYIVTKYAYFNEWERKQQRYAETLNAINQNGKSFSSVEALQEQKKAVNYLKKQIDEYGVYVIDQAIFSLAKKQEKGNKEIELKWVTEQDEKVCPICKKRNGKVYNIRKYPSKPHWGCRCYPEIINKGM